MRTTALSTRGGTLYTDAQFQDGDAVLFGPETRGLPQPVLEIVAAACDYRIWDDEMSPVPRDTLLREAAELLGLFDDAVFTDRYTQLALDVADLGTLYTRFVDQVKRGETLGPDVSMLKVFATETYSRLANLLVQGPSPRGAHKKREDLPSLEAQYEALEQKLAQRSLVLRQARASADAAQAAREARHWAKKAIPG